MRAKKKKIVRKLLTRSTKIYILLHRCNLKIFFFFSFFARIGRSDLTKKFEKVGPFECDELEKHCRVSAKCYPTTVPALYTMTKEKFNYLFLVLLLVSRQIKVTCYVVTEAMCFHVLTKLQNKIETSLFFISNWLFVCRETSSRTRNTDLNFSFVIVYRAGTLVG